MNVVIRRVLGEERELFDRWAEHVKVTGRTQKAAFLALMRDELAASAAQQESSADAKITGV